MSKYDIRKNASMPSDEEINKYKNFDKVVKKAAVLDYRQATKPLYKNFKVLGAVAVMVAVGLIFLFESHEEKSLQIQKTSADSLKQDSIKEPDTNKDTIRAVHAAGNETQETTNQTTEESSVSSTHQEQRNAQELSQQTIPSGTSVAATFPGGETALSSFLSKNIKYPYNAVETPYTGKVEVSVTIGASGSVTHYTILNSPNIAITNEVKRVLKLMPEWKPAIKNGIAVASTTAVFFPFEYKND